MGYAMWADVDTALDFLNYSEVAELTTDLLRDKRMLPVSVGIFGAWGTGKSTLLNLIEKQLHTEEAGNDFIIVRFDVWLYQGFDDARAALMEVISATLLKAAGDNASLAGKAKKLLQRVDKIRLLGLAAEGGAALMGVPTFGALNKGIDALSELLNGSGDVDDVHDVQSAVDTIQKKTKGLIEPGKRQTPPKQIAAFRDEFGNLLDELGKTLVVFIDNLDRCSPKQTIHTLEALRLFLFLPNTAFVVAADEEMVRGSVTAHFKEIDERHVTDYLDKLIQVPVRVPRVGVQEVRAYMFLLFADAAHIDASLLEALRKGLETNIQNSWKDEPIERTEALALLEGHATADLETAFEIADRLAPILASSSSIQGNPRIVKRMLNVIRMRVRLAKRREMSLDEALIAKLAVFERCTDASATASLYRTIQEADDGKPPLLRKLESTAADLVSFQEAYPKEWPSKHLDFVREWTLLKPTLADIDLRPTVYLSRETVPIRAMRTGMSKEAAEALKLLISAPSINARSPRDALKAVSKAEATAVMQTLIAEMRKVADWTEQPPGWNGALILAETVPETAGDLARLIRTVNGTKLKPWLRASLRSVPWWKDKREEAK